MSVRGLFVTEGWQQSEYEGLQDGAETCCDVCFGDCVADIKTAGRGGDAQIFIGSEKNGQI